MADDFVVTSPPPTTTQQSLSSSSSLNKLSSQFEPIDLLAADEMDNDEFADSRLALNSFLMGTSGGGGDQSSSEPTIIDSSVNNWALESSGWGVFDVVSETSTPIAVVASEPNPIRDSHPSNASLLTTYHRHSPTVAAVSTMSSDSNHV